MNRLLMPLSAERSAQGSSGNRLETKIREDFAMRTVQTMRTIRIGSVACTLAIVAAVSVAPSHAQPASQTPQAALAKEAGTLSDKFSGLARVMAGKYDWKPGEGVRSVGDVFNLIVMENGLLAGTLTGAGAAAVARRSPIQRRCKRR
jgi:hypothetical protein